ncbi:transposase [Crocinitomicaceae bacterium]|jgi:putative transposase|nr:transposase [Crocinitomicaceae bacterium]
MANLVKDIKLVTSKMIKEHNLFPDFISWQVGYSAFSYSIEVRENLVRYAQNKEVHHGEISSIDEMRRMLIENDVDFDVEYLE